MEQAIARLAPPTPRNLRRFLDDNRVKMERFRPSWNARSSAGATCSRWDLVKMLPLLRPWLSLDGELRRDTSTTRASAWR